MAAVATAETEPTLLLERIAAFARQDRVQAGSLIVTVFGDAVLPRGARLWLGSLIELLA
ncbi:MAG: phenylacetic acid degradation operon negative regulatory protein PaaX, partial [Tepidimonas sp.]|nr:phenylacetic acid degradation operon negative regulatory protein PaaX [Tepidimonas sp.]